ncbi:Alpha-galactosidase [Bifidobacterium sp. DSM 109963]|uniref:Alpha-galactosidase n=2 Tax=Bifidobacterium panos TaxID=2675321 RepID=A0ABX1T083_9BIFI|nr:glycoside hydrolase family 27 protein [Bifidobacterium sp. DSM 109963]NMN02426.1 Alpha-galactosidase [Bifidobacterium sp. DSM 109963]
MKALNPPMGWNSWDSYGTTVTEEEVLANAALMAERLKGAGWDTVVVDIAWYDPTAKAHGYNTDAPLVLDEYGRQMPDPARFPSAAGGAGFAPLAERIHAMGLNFGIHVMRGIPRLAVERDLPIKGTSWTARDVVDKEHVCVWNPDNYGLDQSHPGAQAWYDAQIDQFAEWGVDFLKVDDMQTPFHRDEIFAYHRAIERAERAHGCDITLSLSPGGWLPTMHVDFLRQVAQMWRISDDLWDRWDDIKAQFARLARWVLFQQTGHWADADMLPLGHIGLRAERGDDRQCALSEEEQRTLLTLWCMGRSPLMVGGDLPTSDEKTLRLLANPALREVTAGSARNAEIIREPLADVWGESTEHAGEYIVWRADAADWGDGTTTAHPGGVYAALFWTGGEPKQVRVALSSLVGLERSGKQWHMCDLWNGEGEASVHLEGEGAYRELVAQLAPHGVAWLVLEPGE